MTTDVHRAESAAKAKAKLKNMLEIGGIRDISQWSLVSAPLRALIADHDALEAALLSEAPAATPSGRAA